MRTIRAIRSQLATIPGCLIDVGPPQLRDTGDIPAVFYDSETYSAQTLEADPSDESDEEVALEPSIVFEIPPEEERQSARELLSDATGTEIKQKISELGVDALGWYMPFHASNVQWGIYIRVEGVVYLASYLDHLQIPLSRKLELAFHFIHRHELFHFATEAMCAQWELVTGLPCWIPGRALKNPLLGYNIREEALANAYALRGFRFPSAQLREQGVTEAFKGFVKACPEGYRDGWKYQSKTGFVGACESLATSYEGCIKRSYRPGSSFDHTVFYPSLPLIDWKHCPIIFVANSQRLRPPWKSATLVQKIDALQETETFRMQLASFPSTIQGKWFRTKQKLGQSVQIRGLDFKPWKPGGRLVFSVRVDRSVRAHIRLNSQNNEWSAEEIGSHSSLGHG